MCDFKLTNKVIVLSKIIGHKIYIIHQEKEDGPLSKFCQEIKDAGEIGEKFLRYIETAKDITLFAPSNSAWDDGNLKNIVRRGNDFEELLKLHVVPNKVLFMDDILRNNQDHVRIK